MEYTCLKESQIPHFKNAPGAVNVVHDSLGKLSVKTVKLTEHNGRAVFVDVPTGTFYDAQTGECLSTRQMCLHLDMPVDALRKGKRKDLSAQSYDGWLNDKRRAAA